MTKLSPTTSRKIFTPLLLVLPLLGACAKHRSPASNFAVESATSTGVMGGQVVDNKSPFRQKVLHLALGVSMKKMPNGSTELSWQANCTASAISPRILLTAAHCVKGQKPEQLYVVLEGNPTSKVINLADWVPAIDYMAHEKYIGPANFYLYDVALILLGQDLPFERVMRIAKPGQFQFPQDLVTIGYGTTSDSINEQEQANGLKGLHFVMKKVMPFDPESKTFGVNQNDHKGFCSGDSGGPGLAYDPDKKEFVILGVVSNASMMEGEQALLNPKNEFSLCIGRGNYTNLLNTEIRTWVQERQAELLARLDNK